MQEERAVLAVRLLGFDPYLPMELRERGWPRRELRLVPMFNTYFFVPFDRSEPAWREIPTQPGVKRLFSTDAQHPTPILDEAIELVRFMEREQRATARPALPGEPLVPIPVGSIAEVVSGALATFRGICSWSDETKVLFLNGILGGRLEVPREMVRVVG